MNEWMETIVLGIVEGITEFLPISSTGHLLVVEHFLNAYRSEFFNVGIQAGAILAVVVIYWGRLWDVCWNYRVRENRDFLWKCGVAFVITAVLGLVARKLGFKLDDSNVRAVAWALIGGGIFIFVAEWWLQRRKMKDFISWPTAILVGAAQVMAGVFPGTSRSAATIIMAMLMGVSRTTATEFSFLLGIPTMFAASGYLLLHEWRDKGVPPTGEIQQFILGFVISMMVAFVAVKWLLYFIRSHTFTPFAWYRLALGIVLMAWALTNGLN